MRKGYHITFIGSSCPPNNIISCHRKCGLAYLHNFITRLSVFPDASSSLRLPSRVPHCAPNATHHSQSLVRDSRNPWRNPCGTLNKALYAFWGREGNRLLTRTRDLSGRDVCGAAISQPSSRRPPRPYLTNASALSSGDTVTRDARSVAPLECL